MSGGGFSPGSDRSAVHAVGGPIMCQCANSRDARVAMSVRICRVRLRARRKRLRFLMDQDVGTNTSAHHNVGAPRPPFDLSLFGRLHGSPRSSRPGSSADEVVGPRRADAGASVGTSLSLAALNRLVDPRSKRSFADWWASTAADRFTRIRPAVLDHRRAWDATHRVSAEDLVEIERRAGAAMATRFGLDLSAVALDRTNFATFIDSTNPSASLAQRGKAKQKRAELRLVGLGLVVTRDGGVPLLSPTYPGNPPDVTQLPAILSELCDRYTALAAGPEPLDQVTVVFDAGQNSQDNFTDLRERKIGYVTSLPPSDHPDLLALPEGDRSPVDPVRFPGLTAWETRKTVYGKETRVILAPSPNLHAGQSRGLDQTPAKTLIEIFDLRLWAPKG
ncbi:MAG: hypothetical protein QG608_1879 [Actinomycetota bacterium]|nr:hypothetical protein [Actinomycetota bacterium]